MKYIDLRLQSDDLTSGHPKVANVPYRVRSHRVRSRETVGNVLDFSRLLEALTYGLLSPTLVAVSETHLAISPISNVTIQQRSRFYITRVGFTIDIANEYEIRWARFAIDVKSIEMDDFHVVKVVSLFPNSNRSATTYMGPLILDASGDLERQIDDANVSGSMGHHFDSAVISFRPTDTSGCWDFFPPDGLPPSESDKLLVNIEADCGFELTTRLQFAVHAPGFGLVGLDCPSVKAKIGGNDD